MKSAETCARCGTELQWNERHLVFWNSHLKKGYIKWYVIGSRDMGRRKEFPKYKGKKLCQICAHEVFTGEDFSEERNRRNSQASHFNVDEVRDQDIPDFPTLRDVLAKDGVVISNFKCPKCSNMEGIPETGKLLICKHCGAPIKPNEISKKIKQLT